MDKGDRILLEDESGRIALRGSLIDAAKGGMVTGVVPALLGRVEQGSDFEVSPNPGSLLFSAAYCT